MFIELETSNTVAVDNSTACSLPQSGRIALLPMPWKNMPKIHQYVMKFCFLQGSVNRNPTYEAEAATNCTVCYGKQMT